ncbi:unnamed protein product [Calicophoron daubneyi]|uniref:RNase III domain-containing protein n=1 Tax=Calicophoron daubneyi TaxID=300641 RepID=A0AAV2TX06_CALDB
MDKHPRITAKPYPWIPPVCDTPSPLPYISNSSASRLYSRRPYDTCGYPKSKHDNELKSPGPSGPLSGDKSKMYEIQPPRILSSPTQSLIAPNQSAYVYTWRLPTSEVIAGLAGVDVECFSDSSQTIGLVFSRPISERDYVCRVPLYLKLGMTRARVAFRGSVCLSQSDFSIVVGAHFVLAELLTDIIHHRISTSSKSNEDSPFRELRFDPPRSLVLAVLTIVGMNGHVVDIEACRQLIKWQRNRKAPDSSVQGDFYPERGVVSAYPVKLNQLSQHHWKGRLVRPLTLPQVDLGVFACSSPCGNLKVKCYRLTRHLNAAQVDAGSTPSEKTSGLKALEFEAKDCVVYPLSAWLWFVLSLVPVITYQITRALLSLEMAQSFASHLTSVSSVPSCTVLLPDRLDAPKCMLRHLRCCTKSDKTADEKDILKVWDESVSSDIFYHLEIPQPRDLIQATTFLGANDAVNLERLEFLGDASLELFATLNVFENLPEDADEGQLTAARMKLITNDKLLKVADEFNWPIYCTSCAYVPESRFLPPCYTVSHPKPDDQHFFVRLFNKPIADTVEALLASFLTNYGLRAAYKFAKYYGIIGCKSDGQSSMWSRLFTDVDELRFQMSSLNLDDSQKQSSAENKAFLLHDSIKYQETSLNAVERVLGYHFNNDRLLLKALTHGPAFSGNYQRSVNKSPEAHSNERYSCLCDHRKPN